MSEFPFLVLGGHWRYHSQHLAIASLKPRLDPAWTGLAPKTTNAPTFYSAFISSARAFNCAKPSTICDSDPDGQFDQCSVSTSLAKIDGNF